MRAFLALVALCSLLLPTLCLAGVFGHACEDCGEGPACGHEERCVEDPCSELMIRPTAGTQAKDLLPAISAAPSLPPLRVLSPTVETAPAPSPLRARALPVPESDLPLLI